MNCHERGHCDQTCDQHPLSATIRVHMERKRVGVRELRQNLSRYLRRVARGERLEVTERGRPVALLGPVGESESPQRRLVASGRARPPQGDLLDLAPPKGRVSTKGTEALQELREDRG
jgi:prevent-host-death family protein